MKRISALVYASATGFTRRYAEMLSERVGLPLCPLDGASGPERGEAVLYLGWLCAGSVKGLKKARRRWDVRGVCAVGMAPAEEIDVERLRQDNGVENLPFFHLRGGYAPEKLTGLYRIMMTHMARLVAKAPVESELDRARRDAFAKGGDWVSSEQLDPVLAWLSAESTA